MSLKSHGKTEPHIEESSQDGWKEALQALRWLRLPMPRSLQLPAPVISEAGIQTEVSFQGTECSIALLSEMKMVFFTLSLRE